MSNETIQVAIVDYGMGNLFSVRQACERAGLHNSITNSKKVISEASAVILPGVGAFGDAMQILERLNLVRVLQDFAATGRPIAGICLGMQLLMTESHEFGRHRGLGLIEGEVVRLPETIQGNKKLKVPHIGWSRIYSARDRGWKGSLLEGLVDGTFMYFVHSYYPKPSADGVKLSFSRYGGFEFCSSVDKGNIFGCQFHPERSGNHGLSIYARLAARIGVRKEALI
jgi:imidazole glycerol-phosphate synthase subunit HisH